MASQPALKPETLPIRLLLAGAANCIAASCTHPIDSLKVRMQIVAEGGGVRPSAAAVLRQLAAEEGLINGIYRGLFASLVRESTYSALRLGLYEPVKNAVGAGDPSAPFALRLLAGGISGTVAAATTNPTDLVKVRLQAATVTARRAAASAGQSAAAAAAPRLGQIAETVATAKHIFLHEGGTRALWQGVAPNVQRAALLTAAQVGTYDESKNAIKRAGLLQEGLSLHVAASLIAGFATAVVTSPVDTAKTRMMNQRQRMAALQAAAASQVAAGSTSASSVAALHMGGSSVAAAVAASHPSAGVVASRAMHAAAASSQIALDAAATVGSAAAAAAHKPTPSPAATHAAPVPVLYKSTADCLRRTWAAEGMRGLYAGFSQQWLRLGPHTVITFLAYEQLRSLAGVRPV